ncbi:uncharacterized protein MYCFIDRAFT_88444 [Pseudocercospora fijiensis CIRAD86]|uniref:Uncharacterized protein n=1 Tax=Pseudocercospora fijiensis (strain CIRAD86) TaxID=383855 RepID=M2Z7S4_PSEFD|nr:uncharacterized protein MYCFIDRAFT_88444 [Pseudocercospora fijiensis CIRAD86]EME85800.1 hypothetical protein MYCFIDRAFT_88444 [Pseudocercospora fijiensis CIRAD86]
MRATWRLRNTIPSLEGGAGLWRSGAPGTHPWRKPVKYDTFKSQYGPQYKIAKHIYGVDARKAMYLGSVAGALGLAAGVGAIFFLDSVPKVKHDILSKLPFIGGYFVTEIPPEDNPF